MIKYIRERYGVPAKRGMRVVVQGMVGRITSAPDNWLRIRVAIGDRKKTIIVHPTDDIAYLVDGEWIMYDASPITIGATEFYDSVTPKEK